MDYCGAVDIISTIRDVSGEKLACRTRLLGRVGDPLAEAILMAGPAAKG